MAVVLVIFLNILIAPLTFNSLTQPVLPVGKKDKIRINIKKSYMISLHSPPPWLVDLFRQTDAGKCQYSNCKWNVDKYLLSDSDVIVFHGPSLDRIPIIRSPKQIWVMLGLESPIHYRKNYRLPAWRSVFNWTMTYRKDSDIYFPYSEVVKAEQGGDNFNFISILKSKKYTVSWAVSHCRTASERDSFVSYLKRYIDDVNVFGKCGNYYCGEWEDTELCFQKMAKEHKFVLSFENSFCTDYITEKAFIPYTQHIIPIVRGGADYQTFLPNGTYIDTSHFTVVKDLADYVMYLDTHREEYMAMLERKSRYTILDKAATYQRAICQVCEKLNNVETYRNIYSDISAWLWKNGGCFYPKDIMLN